VLGGEDDERAAVELAGGLGAVDEPPQPLRGDVGLAVGDLRLARLPALSVGVVVVRCSASTSRSPLAATARATSSPAPP
jgi:hypothetical protein